MNIILIQLINAWLILLKSIQTILQSTTLDNDMFHRWVDRVLKPLLLKNFSVGYDKLAGTTIDNMIDFIIKKLDRCRWLVPCSVFDFVRKLSPRKKQAKLSGKAYIWYICDEIKKLYDKTINGN